MARLHVEISMVDDHGRTLLSAVRDEPTRIDLERDPLYITGRLQHLAGCTLESVHEQALKFAEAGNHG